MTGIFLDYLSIDPVYYISHVVYHLLDLSA